MIKYSFVKLFHKTYRNKDFNTLLKQISIRELSALYKTITGSKTNMHKDELVTFFIKNYGNYTQSILSVLPDEALEVLCALTENDGKIIATDHIDGNVLAVLHYYLLAFSLNVKNGGRIIIMPNSPYHKNLCSFINPDTKKLNSTVISYTTALLDVYGYFEIERLFYYIKKYENLALTYHDFSSLLYTHGFIYGYYPTGNALQLMAVEDVENFEKTRKLHPDLDYYRLTKNQIINGLPLTEEALELLDFYENDLDWPEDFAKDGLTHFNYYIQMNYPKEYFIELILEMGLTRYQEKQLEKLVFNLYNNTRLWIYKGHTRNEMHLPKFIKFKKII